MVRRIARCAIPVFAAVLGAAAPASANDQGEWQYYYTYPEQWRFQAPAALIPPLEAQHLANALQFTDDQCAALTDLIAAADRRFEETWIGLAEKVDDLEEWDDPDRDWARSRNQIRRLSIEAAEQTEKARADLLKDVEIILTDEQRSHWDRAIRGYRRRMNLARYASVKAEAIDLVSVVDTMKAPPDAANDVAQLIESYAAEIDGALTARTAALKQLNRACREFFDKESHDPPDTDAIAKARADLCDDTLRCFDVSTKISDINKRYVKMLGALLPDDEQGRLTQLVETSAQFGAFSDEPRALRLLRRAEALDTAAAAQIGVAAYDPGEWAATRAASARNTEPLTAAQHKKIVALRKDFEKQYAALRVRHHMIDIEEIDSDYRQILCDAGIVTLRRESGDAAHEESDTEKRRNDFLRDLVALNRKSIAKLRAILTVRQRILLQAID